MYKLNYLNDPFWGKFSCPLDYEGGSVITLLIDMIGCCIIPELKGLHFSFIMMPNECTKEINTSK